GPEAGGARPRDLNRRCGGSGGLRRRLPGLSERPDMEPEPEPVTLLVKSPNQRHRDLELSGDRSWSVSHLKAHLSRVYPERPIAESTEQPSGPNQGQSAGYSSSDGVRQRELLRNLPPTGGDNVSRPEATQLAFQGLGPGFSGYTTYGWLQLSWFQQIYARQYYMQYLAATAASGAFVPSPSAQEIPVVSAPAPAPIHNQFPAENQPANQNAAPQVVVNPGANQNLRMNAQGGPIVEEDDEINRDWLDWTYSAATFSVFLSILYFYSSLSRFLMVMGATVVMYLHHVGWFPFRQRPAQNFPNDGPLHEAVNQDPNNNLQEGPDPEMEDPNHLPPDRDVPGEEQTSPSFMSTAWLVFKTFFASLLPEGPPAIAN
ncbi:Homocysteine-responsive endoplasmic reticulum-resident ubiquitin-like domain member 1 protein, partial [Galemys pyrenaicus]